MRKLYIAYGSNLNVEQMLQRCPSARYFGVAEMNGWRLLFKGSKTGNYLTIERKDNMRVPVAIWSITEDDERSLDRYEGFPTFYYKKTFMLNVVGSDGKKESVEAFAYIMHEDRPLGVPTEEYMQRCLKGYRTFKFDPGRLYVAYNNSYYKTRSKTKR